MQTGMTHVCQGLKERKDEEEEEANTVISILTATNIWKEKKNTFIKSLFTIPLVYFPVLCVKRTFNYRRLVTAHSVPLYVTCQKKTNMGPLELMLLYDCGGSTV